MLTNFDVFRKLYDKDLFSEILHDSNGIFWLKLRSISRTEQLRSFCEYVGLEHKHIGGRQLFEYVYNQKPDRVLLEKFIRNIYHTERSERQKNEDYLISQLYQMKVFNWGGLYQNSLEQTIVDNYVKKIQNWDQLNRAIENELHLSMRGYVQCSWYNHWSSILIEDIFKDHTSVLPALGQVKKVDFFIHDFPFDLKVTYFPDGYMKLLRRDHGLSPELTELKRFCKREQIWFDSTQPEGTLYTELYSKISEYPSSSARDFIEEFNSTRTRLIQETIDNPRSLKIWLYENQGIRRFDASNRFFLILVDMKNLDESWKLKRNKMLLVDAIHKHLDSVNSDTIKELRLEFQWQDAAYETYADSLFVVFR
ncbi:MAG: hypothetical protein U0350_14920 [Caldilineaceae bacterium]